MLFTAIVMDVSWLLKFPLAGIVSLLIAIAAQTRLLSGGLPTCSNRSAVLLQEYAWLLWLVACGVWMMAELLFDGQEPEGMLSGFEVDTKRYGPSLLFASITMAVLCVSYVAGSLYAWIPHLRSQLEVFSEHTKIDLCTSCWFGSWLLMESAWVHFDYLVVQHGSTPHWAMFVLIPGVMAAVGCLYCSCANYTLGFKGKAIQNIAEFCWVSGNALWLASDAKHGRKNNSTGLNSIAMVVFMCGCAAAAISGMPRFNADIDEKQRLLNDDSPPPIVNATPAQGTA